MIRGARQDTVDEEVDGPRLPSWDALADPGPIVAFGLFLLVSVIFVVPYLAGGPGFFVDDWRNLARLDTVGRMRSAEASRFASRPGAWAVETVLYPTLRDHAVAWVLVLAALSAAAASALYALLRRFLTPRLALLVALMWIVLPNHTSLRMLPNSAPMTVGLTLLVIGICLMDDGRLMLGAVAASLGGFCYEVMLPPALISIVVLHLVRGRGERRQAIRAAGVVVIAGLLMLIHPTYAVGRGLQGTPRHVVSAHVAGGLTTVPSVALVLGVLAAIGSVVAAVAFVRGDREVGGGPWLVLAGWAVIAVGMSAFILKWPTGVRGLADRTYVVSSVGSALVWVGIGRLARRIHPMVAGAGAVAFLMVVVAANVALQRDWSTVATDTRRMIEGVECRYDGDPPSDLAVGPYVPSRGGVHSLHPFYLDDATRVTVGHPLDFVLAENEASWSNRAPQHRVTWDEMISVTC